MIRTKKSCVFVIFRFGGFFMNMKRKIGILQNGNAGTN